jgi:hypothetical protein
MPLKLFMLPIKNLSAPGRRRANYPWLFLPPPFAVRGKATPAIKNQDMNRSKKQLIAAISILMAIATVHAAPEIIFGEDVSQHPVGGINDVPRPTNITNTLNARAQFFMRLAQGVVTEGFEGYPVGSSPANLVFGTNIATLSGNEFVDTFPAPTWAPYGGFPLSGTNALGLYGNSGQFFTITFSTPQSAFGFFCSDVENNELRFALISSSGDRRNIQVPVTQPQGSGGCFYFGVIDKDSPFTAVEFHNDGAGDDGFDFDDMTIAIPEQILPPRLSIRISQVELCWDTTANKVYQLQFHSSLATNEWLPLGSPVIGSGLRYCTNDAVLPNQPQRFYRVVTTNSP